MQWVASKFPPFWSGNSTQQPHSDNSTSISLQNRREGKKKGIKIWWVHNFFFSIHLSLTDGRSLFGLWTLRWSHTQKAALNGRSVLQSGIQPFPLYPDIFFFYFIIPFCKIHTRADFFQAKGGKVYGKGNRGSRRGVTFYKETVCVT